MTVQRGIEHSNNGTTLADLLERILGKGVVIAGDVENMIVDSALLPVRIPAVRVLRGLGAGNRHRLVGEQSAV